MSQEALVALLAGHGFGVANLSYRLNGDGQFFEYRMTIRTRSFENQRKLATTLGALHDVVEFRISPTGD